MRSVVVTLEDIPLQVRSDAARRLVMEGDAEPLDALAAVVFGTSTAGFPTEPTVADRCIRGHILNEENLYLHPTRGWRRCRACSRLYKKKHRTKDWPVNKVPCAFCGKPAKPRWGKGPDRCRACYDEQRRAK